MCTISDNGHFIAASIFFPQQYLANVEWKCLGKCYPRLELCTSGQSILEPDKGCILLFQSIGNGIHPSIRLEVDYPSRHEDGNLPILDLKVWIEKRRRVGDGGQDRDVQVVLHVFYFKVCDQSKIGPTVELQENNTYAGSAKSPF